ncbi:hypothetical protein AB0395_39780 [Streptosporangium sp. NPDC051023]|uniref:hypothetical protein n=1 Tax=Streptosporangium sp. NPDC051023 TaxID=3155410 RepID=UPI00344BA6B7
MPNQFPGDFLQDVKDIQDTAQAAQAAATRREPLTSASQGWWLPNRAAPATPANGVHIYASGGEFWVKTAAGVTRGIIPPQAATLSGPASFVVSSAPTNYNQGWGGDVRAALLDLHTVLSTLITQLKAAGIVAP